MKEYQSFSEFYPFYLSQHLDTTCRSWHLFGTTLFLCVVLYALGSGNYAWLLAAPVCGYGCAWIGHFKFEHNKPATFTYPWYSFMGDFVMLKDTLTGQLDSKLKGLDLAQYGIEDNQGQAQAQ